jgi:2-hydroxy-3-oxopropionate reductase
MKIGFIGLGIMGAPMVGRLLDGSHQVFANDLKPIQPEILEKGATQVSSAREATEMGDVIIVMVPDTPDVEIVLFGENGVAQGLSSNKIVVDMSSISPVETKEFAGCTCIGWRGGRQGGDTDNHGRWRSDGF